MKVSLLLIVALLLCQCSFTQNKPAQVEDATKTATLEQHFEGQVQWIPGLNNTKFFSLYKPATTSETLGKVLLLNQQDNRPNAPDVIGPLRRILPDDGWTTLTIEMPSKLETGVNKTDDLTPARFNRINNGLEFFQDKPGNGVFVISYGRGAEHALKYLSHTQQSNILGLILISGYSEKQSMTEQQWESFKRKHIPVLDLFVKDDNPKVLRDVNIRSEHYSSNNSLLYRRVELQQIDKSYQNSDDILVKGINSWLHRKAAAVTKNS